MKKLLSMAMLCLILFACQKTKESVPEQPVEAEEAVAPSLPPNPNLRSITVTTEAALKSAVAAAVPGDIITISGTINLTSTLQLLASGTSSSKINITGGTLNCSGIASGWGVKCNGSYWNVTNMTIKNGPDCGLVFQTGGYNYVYNVTTSGNHDSGLQVYNGSHHNNISYCNSNDNYDTQNGGENADGFACKLSAGAGNKFDHCTANHNSDDGWDLYG